MLGSTHRFLVNVTWLVKLRWVAVFGQLLTIGGSALGMGIELTLWPLLVVIGLTVLSNAVLMWWYAHLPHSHVAVGAEPWNLILALVMTMDMLSLTTLLYATGGPTNPFCLFFFVNLSLSAVVLGRRSAWALLILSVLCFAWLLFQYIPVPQLELGPALLPIVERQSVSLAQMGLFVAFGTCASVIVYFMTRLTGELREQEISARLAQQKQARSEKLEALGTLAAGAAHELSTPLTTIALVAKDVESAIRRQASGEPVDSEVIEDVELIREELDRCKRILGRMSSHSGQSVGEMMQDISAAELWQEVQEGLVEAGSIDCQILLDAGEAMLHVPVDALSQAIRGLVQNAMDASPRGERVHVVISRIDNRLRWTIEDAGPGMSEDVLNRVSEPFFTTKPPGKGMGLGVFLAKNVIERLAGGLDLKSSSGTGTTVIVELPCESSSVSSQQS